MNTDSQIETHPETDLSTLPAASLRQEADSKLQATAASASVTDDSDIYHSLSSETSIKSDRVVQSKDVSNLFQCGTYLPKVGSTSTPSSLTEI